MLSTDQEFAARHIGPNDSEIKLMLKELGFSELEELAGHVIPKAIRSHHKFEKLGSGISEHHILQDLQATMKRNKIFKSYIGAGYHDCITPTVIQRNILENPVWYTAYTPYQPEISQGRLEALLNFQTTIIDLTGMEIANASLLDEGTAAAEAMAMAHSLAKNKANAFVVSPRLHPHVLAVLKTRAEPLGLEMIEQEPVQYTYEKPVFAAFVSYPTTDGAVEDYSELAKKIHDHGALLVADVDLLSLALLTPPGEWGADIVVGNSQRLGVPLGNGGPHAAFMATRDAYKRLLPGRLVGVSVDAQGKPALRLALQTREQHIRREKATSNICTAQVLLANMASMYAVYHGPKGLKQIATRIHEYTCLLEKGLIQLGYSIQYKNYFDTLVISTEKASDIIHSAENLGLNFRLLKANTLAVSLNETVDDEALLEILQAFNLEPRKISAEQLFSWGGESQIPAGLRRKSAFLTHPVFNTHHSETELLRYIHHLQNKDLTLTHSMIPLGSCTMKLNATTELVPVSWPEISRMHPFAPSWQMQGYIDLIKDLEDKLADIMGFAAVTLQPNAGSQGEYAGLLVIRKYHHSRGQGHRNVCLIPSSAHGTNPATASMAGMQVVVVACDDNGNVDVKDLKAKSELHRDKLAALMITYPSTHGVFEEGIKEICQVVHDNGGQVYMDGANLNALVGLCRPGEFGADVSHMNLHKTFSIPHGGGGPGVGPIGVAAHLKEFLPSHPLKPECGPEHGIGPVSSAPWGSASILPISWTYITMMGYEGLRKATLVSILNANYIAKKLHPHFPVLYKGREGLVAHECIIDLRPVKKTSGIDVNDVAKRLMDYGFHSPTMSFPVIGTLMVEPTESESLAELDRFIEAMVSIRKEIEEVESKKATLENNVLVNAPHTAVTLIADSWDRPYSRQTAAYPAAWLKTNKYWPPVSRVDNAYGDRNVMCSCPPIEEYEK
jgi:glycine dehydrogenase